MSYTFTPNALLDKWISWIREPYYFLLKWYNPKENGWTCYGSYYHSKKKKKKKIPYIKLEMYELIFIWVILYYPT